MVENERILLANWCLLPANWYVLLANWCRLFANYRALPGGVGRMRRRDRRDPRDESDQRDTARNEVEFSKQRRHSPRDPQRRLPNVYYGFLGRSLVLAHRFFRAVLCK